MEEAIKLHDWFFAFDKKHVDSPSWSITAWGRGHASTSSSKAPLQPHPMLDCISPTLFMRQDGVKVQLLGDSDTQRAAQAGVPLPVRNGFKHGIPSTWQAMTGLGATFHAIRPPPDSLVPPGASPPPSPPPAPGAPAIEMDSDDEALPETLFDLGTGYQRPDGAPRTVKQLVKMLVSFKGSLRENEEPFVARQDRDADYDEAVEEQEEEEKFEEVPRHFDQGVNGASHQHPADSAIGYQDAPSTRTDPGVPTAALNLAAQPASPDHLPSRSSPASLSLPVLATSSISSAPAHLDAQARVLTGSSPLPGLTAATSSGQSLASLHDDSNVAANLEAPGASATNASSQVPLAPSPSVPKKVTKTSPKKAARSRPVIEVVIATKALASRTPVPSRPLPAPHTIVTSTGLQAQGSSPPPPPLGDLEVEESTAINGQSLAHEVLVSGAAVSGETEQGDVPSPRSAACASEIEVADALLGERKATTPDDTSAAERQDSPSRPSPQRLEQQLAQVAQAATDPTPDQDPPAPVPGDDAPTEGQADEREEDQLVSTDDATEAPRPNGRASRPPVTRAATIGGPTTISRPVPSLAFVPPRPPRRPRDMTSAEREEHDRLLREAHAAEDLSSHPYGTRKDGTPARRRGRIPGLTMPPKAEQKVQPPTKGKQQKKKAGEAKRAAKSPQKPKSFRSRVIVSSSDSEGPVASTSRLSSPTPPAVAPLSVSAGPAPPGDEHSPPAGQSIDPLALGHDTASTALEPDPPPAPEQTEPSELLPTEPQPSPAPKGNEALRNSASDGAEPTRGLALASDPLADIAVPPSAPEVAPTLATAPAEELAVVLPLELGSPPPPVVAANEDTPVELQASPPPQPVAQPQPSPPAEGEQAMEGQVDPDQHLAPGPEAQQAGSSSSFAKKRATPYLDFVVRRKTTTGSGPAPSTHDGDAARSNDQRKKRRRSEEVSDEEGFKLTDPSKRKRKRKHVSPSPTPELELSSDHDSASEVPVVKPSGRKYPRVKKVVQPTDEALDVRKKRKGHARRSDHAVSDDEDGAKGKKRKRSKRSRDKSSRASQALESDEDDGLTKRKRRRSSHVAFAPDDELQVLSGEEERERSKRRKRDTEGRKEKKKKRNKDRRSRSKSRSRAVSRGSSDEEDEEAEEEERHRGRTKKSTSRRSKSRRRSRAPSSDVEPPPRTSRSASRSRSLPPPSDRRISSSRRGSRAPSLSPSNTSTSESDVRRSSKGRMITVREADWWDLQKRLDRLERGRSRSRSVEPRSRSVEPRGRSVEPRGRSREPSGRGPSRKSKGPPGRKHAWMTDDESDSSTDLEVSEVVSNDETESSEQSEEERPAVKIKSALKKPVSILRNVMRPSDSTSTPSHNPRLLKSMPSGSASTSELSSNGKAKHPDSTVRAAEAGSETD